jgi:hypothetical protein
MCLPFVPNLVVKDSLRDNSKPISRQEHELTIPTSTKALHEQQYLHSKC